MMLIENKKILKCLNILLVTTFFINALFFVDSQTALAGCSPFDPGQCVEDILDTVGSELDSCVNKGGCSWPSNDDSIQFFDVSKSTKLNRPIYPLGAMCANQPDTGKVKSRFVRAVIARGPADNIASIRCSQIEDGTTDKGRYWTRKFMVLKGERAQAISVGCPDNRFVDQIVANKPHELFIRCREINVSGEKAKWSSDYWTRTFLTDNYSKLKTAECPKDAVVAHMILTPSGSLAIRCRRPLIDGKRIDMDETKYWTSNFATINMP